MSAELPDGWQRASLGDVLRLEYGRALSATVREHGDVPVYGSNGMVGLHSTPLVHRKGIVVGRKGTAGSVTVTDGPFWPIDTAYYVEPRQEVDFDWLAAALHSARLSDLNESTGVPGLNRDKVYREAIVLPPLAEQRRIAEVLQSVDEAISAVRATVKISSSVRQNTLDALMHERMAAEGGATWKLDEVAEVRTGLAKNKNAKGTMVQMPYLRVANVQDGWFDLSEMKEIEVESNARERYELRPGDVLLTEGGDFDKLGRGGVWKGQVDPCLHQNHVFCVRPNSDLLVSEFLALLTQSYLGRAYFLSCAKRTTNLASINSTQLRALPVPVSDLGQQSTLVAEIGAIDAMIKLEEDSLLSLLCIKDSLSSDLLSGRVRVPA